MTTETIEHEGPALVDLQVNGFAGVDYNAADVPERDLVRSLDAMADTGVGLCLPTIITSSTEHFVACATRVLAVDHPIVAGLHMEGPYISPVDGYRGAHPVQHVVDASVDDFMRRYEATDGRIRLLTLAPEVPGAVAVIEAAVALGVRVALGHTAATGAQIAEAVHAGATLSTHLGNGCPAVLPRHPNVIWDQLGEDGLVASLIVDGHHLPPSTVRAMVRAKSPARTILVTDAMMAAGAGPGRYVLGGLEVEASPDGRVAAPGSVTLAGSALTMPQAVGNTVRWVGQSLEVAWAMGSTLAASLIGEVPSCRARVVWSADWSTVLSSALLR